MSTTSTVVTVKKQLVAQIAAVLTVPVSYAWPGKDTANECVFLGPHPELEDIRIDGSSRIPTVVANRKQRQEDYTIRVTAWSFRPDLTSAGAEACETRGFALAAEVDNVLANDPRIGLGPTVIQHALISSVQSNLWPFQSGWAAEVQIDVDVSARLT